MQAVESMLWHSSITEYEAKHDTFCRKARLRSEHEVTLAVWQYAPPLRDVHTILEARRRGAFLPAIVNKLSTGTIISHARECLPLIPFDLIEC